jgi:hypothetical protein
MERGGTGTEEGTAAKMQRNLTLAGSAIQMDAYMTSSTLLDRLSGRGKRSWKIATLYCSQGNTREAALPPYDHYNNSDEEDEDYKQPPEDDSSAEDEEVTELRHFARQIRKDIKAKNLGFHGTLIGNVHVQEIFVEMPNLDDPGSPHIASSEEYSYEENSDGEVDRWISLENRFDSKEELPVFALGMAFRCSRQFKKAVVKYGLKAHKSLKFVTDEKTKVRAVCDWQGCKWLIYGSITTRSKWFKVVTFQDVHTCPPRSDNRLVTSNLIAKHYYQQIKDNPTWKIGLMKAAVLRDLFADVSNSKLKRAKWLVLQQALDEMKGEYSKVYDYQLELLRSNPGSTVVVTLDPEIADRKVFHCMYVCLDGLKKGFLAGCRKVIGLDGCWFKGAHNGNLLCAIGRDANNQMYPVAWAAVPYECYDTWFWFLGLLQKDLKITNGGEDWVLISDQQKGLLKAVNELVPNAEHRMCARHIYANWRKNYTDKKLQKIWWRCAKASSRSLFNLYRAYLAQDTPEGAQDMMNTSPEHWSRAYFRIGSFCDSVDNNLCESFNNSIMEARFYPVISMCEHIRKKLMVRIQEKRTRCSNWTGVVCPNIFKKLKMNIEWSGNCWVLWNGADGFEVQEREDRRYTVSLEKRECTCRYWQLSGLPYCHAISCIYKASQQLDDYIAPCYSIQAYQQTYQYVLQPVEGPENWPTSSMPKPEPPAYVKMPGRPKTERRREQGEEPKGTKLSKVGTKMSCRLCGKSDHNARRCPKNPEALNKINAHIKRDRTKKRKMAETSTSTTVGANKVTKTTTNKVRITATQLPLLHYYHVWCYLICAKLCRIRQPAKVQVAVKLVRANPQVAGVHQVKLQVEQVQGWEVHVEGEQV